MGEARLSSGPGLRIGIVGGLALGLGSVPGFLFGLLTPVLTAGEGIGRTAIGVLVGLFFGATGLGSVAAGRLTERIGARAAVVADLLVLACCLLVAAVVGTYAVLVVVAVVAGAGYALTNTGTTLAVATVVRPAERTRVMAVRTAGIPALVVGASPAAGPLAAAVGWRPVLAGLSVPVLVVAAAVWRVLPDARPTVAATGPARLPAGFGWFPVAAFLLIVGSQPVMVWSVAFLGDGLGVPIAPAGLLAAGVAVVGVAAVLVMAAHSGARPGLVHTGRRAGDGTGAPMGAAVSSARAVSGRRAAVACGVAGVGSVVLAAAAWTTAGRPGVGGPAVVGLGVAGLGIATVAHLLAIGLLHALIVATAPAAAGRAAGVAMTGYFLGALVSGPAFGAVVDGAGWSTAWLLCACLVWLAATCFLRCGRRGAGEAGSRRGEARSGRGRVHHRAAAGERSWTDSATSTFLRSTP